MNQKIINIILAAGLAIVLFLHFGTSKTSATAATSASDANKNIKIAYVDLDLSLIHI